jgi:DNA-directed RNA polymerase subunit beta
MTDNGTSSSTEPSASSFRSCTARPASSFKRGAIYVAKIIRIAVRGSSFEYDQKNLLYVRVGKRKFLASIFLRALGLWFNQKVDLNRLRH